MSGYVQERYNPQVVGVNATVGVTGASLGGFLCKTAGTVTFTKANGSVVIDAIPVAAGIYLPMPFHTGGHGGTFTTAGGASGTLGVG